MPATFAHPIATIPLARRPLVFSGLVVGSIAPDLEYLFRLQPTSTVSHTGVGLFVFCLPVGLAVLLVWHRFLKRPLVELAPGRHYAALVPLCGRFSFTPGSRFACLVLSILLGATTHIAWDAFTHSFGWGVRELTVLSAPLLESSYGTLRIYKVLQHGSTLLGSALLLALYLRWFRRRSGQYSIDGSSFSATYRLLLATLLAVVALGTGFVSARLALPLPYDFDSTRAFVIRIALLGGATLVLELLLFAAWWHSPLSSAVRGPVGKEQVDVLPRSAG